MEKPLIIKMNEAENELVKTINDIITKYNIPCYLLEMIFDKIHRQLKDGAKTEIDRSYQEFIALAEKAEGDTE